MRVLVTGGAGLVAGHLCRSAPPDVELHATWRRARPPAGATAHRVDLVDAAAAAEMFTAVRPDVVVHTAYTQAVRADVVDATRSVAAAVAATGARLVHLSSDMVFGGDDAPYTEDDPPDPRNDYGRWKLEAEQVVTSLVPAAVVTRTSLVVSDDPPDHQSAWLARALAAGEEVTLFDDEFRTPVRADDLAVVLWELARDGAPGVVHLPGPERLSRAELGLRVAVAAGLPTAGIRTAPAASHPEPRPRDLTLRSVRRPNSVGRRVGE